MSIDSENYQVGPTEQGGSIQHNDDLRRFFIGKEFDENFSCPDGSPFQSSINFEPVDFNEEDLTLATCRFHNKINNKEHRLASFDATRTRADDTAYFLDRTCSDKTIKSEWTPREGEGGKIQYRFCCFYGGDLEKHNKKEMNLCPPGHLPVPDPRGGWRISYSFPKEEGSSQFWICDKDGNGKKRGVPICYLPKTKDALSCCFSNNPDDPECSLLFTSKYQPNCVNVVKESCEENFTEKCYDWYLDVPEKEEIYTSLCEKNNDGFDSSKNRGSICREWVKMYDEMGEETKGKIKMAIRDHCNFTDPSSPAEGLFCNENIRFRPLPEQTTLEEDCEADPNTPGCVQTESNSGVNCVLFPYAPGCEPPETNDNGPSNENDTANEKEEEKPFFENTVLIADMEVPVLVLIVISLFVLIGSAFLFKKWNKSQSSSGYSKSSFKRR